LRGIELEHDDVRELAQDSRVELDERALERRHQARILSDGLGDAVPASRLCAVSDGWPAPGPGISAVNQAPAMRSAASASVVSARFTPRRAARGWPARAGAGGGPATRRRARRSARSVAACRVIGSRRCSCPAALATLTRSRSILSSLMSVSLP